MLNSSLYTTHTEEFCSMASELDIRQLLDLYFKDGLSFEEKMRMFETIRNNPSLNETIQSIFDGIEPAKV